MTLSSNVTTTSRSTHLLFLLLLAVPAKGFVPLHRVSLSTLPSPLRNSGSGTGVILSGSFIADTTTSTSATAPRTTAQAPVPRDIPSWAYLPSKPDFSNMDLPLQTEIWIGRLAMVGAIGLVATEVLTGASFADQIVDLLVAPADVAGVQ